MTTNQTTARYTAATIQSLLMNPGQINAEIASLERIASGEVKIPGYGRLFATNDIIALKTWI